MTSPIAGPGRVALVAYDGSSDAQAAIDRAAQLMPGATAIVVTVWEPHIEMLVRTGAMGMGMFAVAAGMPDEAERIDAENREAALERATEGARRASDAGLEAAPQIAQRDGDVATTVLSAATEADADVIVIGTRGRGSVRSLLLGSTSHAVLQHADRSVMVVPGPALADQRHEHVHRALAMR